MLKTILSSIASMAWKDQVVLCRSGIFAACVLVAFCRQRFDEVISHVWQLCKQSQIFKHDSWEPGVVVVCWTSFTLFWYALDMHVPKLRSYRIQSKEDFSHWEYEGGYRKQEALMYVLPLVIFDCFYPRRSLPAAPPTLAVLLADVFLCLFFYDLLFFFCHLLLHSVPWLYKAVHAKHHTKSVQRASESLRLTVVEEVVNTGCSIAAVNITGAHPLSRTLYNILIVWLIIELHSGYDFPWMLQNVLPLELWGGSKRHDVHHQHGSVYYQKFFTYLDNAFGYVQQPKSDASVGAAHTKAE